MAVVDDSDAAEEIVTIRSIAKEINVENPLRMLIAAAALTAVEVDMEQEAFERLAGKVFETMLHARAVAAERSGRMN